MENNNQIMMKEKLGFWEIVTQSLQIPFKNPKFILITFLTSLPLFCSILIHEAIFQDTLLQLAKHLSAPHFSNPLCHLHGNCYDYIEFTATGTVNPSRTPVDYLIAELPLKLLNVVLLYLGVVHLLDLINAGAIVNSASVIYLGEEISLNFKDVLRKPIKGSFITSIYALLLASLALLGLSSLAFHIVSFFIPVLDNFFFFGVNVEANFFSIISTLFFGALFTVLLGKYMEWSAIWNTGIVISVLDDQKCGDVALGVSAYFSRGNRLRGAFLNTVFFVWKVGLRLMCLYVRWKNINGGGSSRITAIAAAACLVCVSNVMKWVAFTVYFYDCKRRFLEKKVDVEVGRSTSKAAK